MQITQKSFYGDVVEPDRLREELQGIVSKLKLIQETVQRASLNIHKGLHTGKSFKGEFDDAMGCAIEAIGEADFIVRKYYDED